MDGPRGHFEKWNKSNRERQILYDFTYMWNLKNKTNKTEQKQTHRYWEQTDDYQRGEGGRLAEKRKEIKNKKNRHLYWKEHYF